MLILAIESSCDETCCAIGSFTEDKYEILSNIVASQIDIHALYGGVVPEIASRAHTEALTKITKEALEEAKVTLNDIDAVAVTYAPGLIGALLTGVNFAKGLAFSNGKPLIPVNHIKGHISASYIENSTLKPPFLALCASGGHTSIVKVKSFTDFETIGRTRDDAIGECFDKTARVMGIPYPGGAEMDRLASLGDSSKFKFPSAAISGDNLDFSFSGIKTSVINTLHTLEQKSETYKKEDVAASLTKSIVESIITKIGQALDETGYDKVILAGGVAANSHIRKHLGEFCGKRGVKFICPSKKYCGDNGSMIAVQGYFEYLSGVRADETLNAVARP